MATVLQQVISSALPNFIETVEVRSAFSPPVILNVREILKADQPPNPIVKRVKPTIIIKGGVGQQVIAPAGAADPNEWKRNALIIGGVTAGVAVLGTMALFSVGVFAGRRGERRRAASSVGSLAVAPAASLPVIFGIGVASSVVGGLIVVRMIAGKGIPT